MNELPDLLLQLYNSVTHNLRTSFSQKPPHTIQRFAELILYPTKHYKTLPAWLRAVDRVVSVSSTADIFPLSDTPAVVNGVNGDGGGGILWNNSDTRNEYDNSSLGSDESLGGALLTPIPWLRNGIAGEDAGEDSTHLGAHDNSGADGLGSLPSDRTDLDPLVPERADGAVTQGELMRMEQEAGVVPAAQDPQHTNASRTMAGAEDGTYAEDEDGEDLVPHARGPDVVGAVDMGRVDGQDVQIRIGSPPVEGQGKTADPNDAQTVLPGHDISSSSSSSTTANAPAPSVGDSEDFEIVLKDTPADSDAEEMQLDDADTKPRHPPEEQDEDIVLVDADGKTDEDTSKADISGENIGPDAADASTVT